MTTDSTPRLERWRNAPLVPLERLTLNGPILIIAPHADDETIGCGGLICYAVEAGTVVHIAVLTNGAASHPHSKTHPPSILAKVRQHELLSAAKVLGVLSDNIHFFGRPDGHLSRDDKSLMDAADQLTARSRFKAIFTTWGGDGHPDHKAAYAIGVDLARRHDAACWAYPVWGKIYDSDDADTCADTPAFRFPIAQALATKMAALGCHSSQLGNLITDDPSGFALSDNDVDHLVDEWELFIRTL